MGRETLRNKRGDSRRPIGSKHPALIVLEGLLTGLEIDLSGQKYVMGLDQESNSDRISTPVCWNGKHKLVGIDLSLDTFLWLCSKVSCDELTIIGANIALNKIHRSKER